LTPQGVYVKQGKTGAEVLISYSPYLYSLIDRAKMMAPQIPGEYLIRTRKGKRYSSKGFQSTWKRAMAKHVKAGDKRFSLQDLRSVSADGADMRRKRAIGWAMRASKRRSGITCGA